MVFHRLVPSAGTVPLASVTLLPLLTLLRSKDQAPLSETRR
jgi:hypothetical protein